MSILLITIVATFLAVANDSGFELHKINALLQAVQSSDMTFIRNGAEYSAKDAYEHLQKKLESAQKSWFAPAKDKWTAHLFIEKIASRSSISGSPYMIRLKDGRIVEAGVWLKEKLREIESRAQ